MFLNSWKRVQHLFSSSRLSTLLSNMDSESFICLRSQTFDLDFFFQRGWNASSIAWFTRRRRENKRGGSSWTRRNPTLGNILHYMQNFNYKIKPISFVFSVGLLWAHSSREFLYGLIEIGKPSSRHARDVLANVVPTLWYEHHDVRTTEVMVDRLG